MLPIVVVVAFAGIGVWSEPQRPFPALSAPLFSPSQPYLWYFRPQQQGPGPFNSKVYQEAAVNGADQRNLGNLFRPNKPDPITDVVTKLVGLQSNIDRLLSKQSCPKNELESFGINCFSLIQSCYCRVPVAKSVIDATAFCKAFGFDGLVSLQTRRESQIVTDMFQTVAAAGQTIHWTSGSDARTEGNFIWTTTGETFGQTSWLAGEPVNSNALNCVQLDVTTGTWVAAACADAQPFICEWGHKTFNPLT